MFPPRFLYFDLGNVLLKFSVEVMCRQMAEVAGIEPRRVHEVLFSDGLQADYELGRITSRGFHERFCAATGAAPDAEALRAAACDIFTLNVGLVPVVAGLYGAGYRLGILSNTCEAHWEHCRRRFRLLDELFGVHVLSYRVGAMKPDAAMFRAAAEAAGVEPHAIFFVDDIARHVAGARAAGFDAVPYTTTADLVAELRRRGIQFNY
ncbi:MAG: HAD family phosphatase [Thermoguttaceae bacterium]|jgi:putative hydrolase of the HAD superfamily|nr:HAD family phosphatase [Thermoguttaceae bacterium]